MHRKVKAVISAGMLVTVMATATSCSSIKEITPDQLPQNTAIPINTMSIIPESTATPEPKIEIREPVKSHSPMRIQTDVPNGVYVPEFYHAIDLDGVNHVVYAFNSKSGKTEFRVYAEVDELEDEVVMNTLSGFFKANVYPSGSIYIIETNKEDTPINTSQEDPATYIGCVLPTKANIKSYISKEKKAADEYQKAVKKAEKNNEPIPEPTPWNGQQILTNDTPEYVLPKHVKQYKKVDGLYYYVNIYGEYEYRQYATNNGITGAFYLSDETGKVASGALPVDTEMDFSEENAKGKKAIEPPEDRTYRIPVVLLFSNGDFQTVYEVY